MIIDDFDSFDKYVNTEILAWQTTMSQSQGAGVAESLTTQRPSRTLVKVRRRGMRKRKRIKRRCRRYRRNQLEQNSELPDVVA